MLYMARGEYESFSAEAKRMEELCLEVQAKICYWRGSGRQTAYFVNIGR